MSVSCDCCGQKVDERSLQKFATKFICTGCRGSNSDIELAEGLYGVDAQIEYGNEEYCCTVTTENGIDYVGNDNESQDAVELAIKSMLESQNEEKIKKFLEQFEGCGLNADFWCMAWKIKDGIYILDTEEGEFVILKVDLEDREKDETIFSSSDADAIIAKVTELR